MGQSIINNPETLATLGKKTQDEDKKKQKNHTHNITQKTKKMSNTYPTQKTESESTC